MQYYLFMVELVLLLTKDTLTFVEIKMKVMQLGNWIIIAASTDKTSSQYRMLMVDTGQSGHTARRGVYILINLNFNSIFNSTQLLFAKIIGECVLIARLHNLLFHKFVLVLLGRGASLGVGGGPAVSLHWLQLRPGGPRVGSGRQ